LLLLIRETILTENKRVLQHGYTATEFAREKVKVLERLEKSVKEMDKTESNRLAQRYVYNYLKDYPIPSPDQTLELYKKYLPIITLAEVNKLAGQWITQENRVVVITGPDKKEVVMPSESEVMDIISKVDAMDVEAYEDDISDEPLLAKIPTRIPMVKENTNTTMHNGPVQ